MKPRVLLSACLNLYPCRYNGAVIEDAATAALAEFVEFIPVCPEVQVGLGVPRDPVQLVLHGTRKRMVQIRQSLDLTARMRQFAETFLGGLGSVHGAVLKAKSPSCGIDDAKIFRRVGDEDPIGFTSGLFAEAMMRRFPHLPIIDELKLQDSGRRHDFLMRVFTLARFDQAKTDGFEGVRTFHEQHRYVLQAFSSSGYRSLSTWLATLDQSSDAGAMQFYEREFCRLIRRIPRRADHARVLYRIAEDLASTLSHVEHRYLLDQIRRWYRKTSPPYKMDDVLASFLERQPAIAPAVRLYLNPYPISLVVRDAVSP